MYRNTSTSDMKNLQKVFSEILQRSSLSICTNWLKEELLVRNKRSMKVRSKTRMVYCKKKVKVVNLEK